MKLDVGRTIVAGILGTLAMTILMLMAPRMGLPPMDIGAMLGSLMGGNVALGWVAHFMIGVVLAFIYAVLFAEQLSGSPPLRGALFSLLPWLMAQVAVMPMMGAGLFGGSIPAAVGSLLGHVVYGAVLGAVYGTCACAVPSTQGARG